MLPHLTRTIAVLLTAALSLIATANAQPITPSKALSPPVGLEGTFLDPFRIIVFQYLEYELEEDDTYADLCLEGEETRGTRAFECMPHRRTKTYSALDLSPWYLTNIQCDGSDSCILDNPVGPYLGPIYRGDENVFRYINRLVQPTEDTAVDVCKRIITPNSDVDPHVPDYARMELDNCTDQYILNRADLPMIPTDDQGEMPDVKEGREEEFCQPLRMIPLQLWEQEYIPSQYYVEAWRKTMENTAWLARFGTAPKEPFYLALGAGLEDTIDIRDDYGLVNINDLVEPWGGETQYERIYDPTHPFSPRWDFTFNERDHFSPATAAYGGDPRNAVRCSGEAFYPVIKTDIMNWRLPSFSLYITWRIAFNIVCYDVKIFGIPCFEFFNANSNDPPCPTKWNGEEKVEEELGKQFRQILCGPPHIEDLCEHITKPVAPANALKMRENDDENFPFGVPDGYTFEEYFDDHRPYMRCWDTGLECGRDIPPVVGEGVLDPYLMYPDPPGYLYAIMGAGREGESCTMGGDDFNVSQFDLQGDPIMAWMELKLYALRGMRKAGLNCLVRHEKLFKPMTGEEIIANRAGGQYQKPTPDTHGDLVRYSTFPWPLQWRGYISDPEAEYRYPNFGSDGGAPIKGTGLDDAKAGEVLLFDETVVQSGGAGTWRLPYVAFVTDACNDANECPPAPSHFVKAVAYNHGKFPDACGNTEALEQGEEYTMWKGALPDYNMELFEGAESYTQSCDDPYNSFCTENYWGDVKRYFPKDDQRR